MLVAARQAADEVAGGACGVLAVTVLTSRCRSARRGVGRADALDMECEVLRLAELAATAAVHGIVCSGGEVGAVRADSGIGWRRWSLHPSGRRECARPEPGDDAGREQPGLAIRFSAAQ